VIIASLPTLRKAGRWTVAELIDAAYAEIYGRYAEIYGRKEETEDGSVIVGNDPAFNSQIREPQGIMTSDRVKLREIITATLRESQLGRLANFAQFTVQEVSDTVKALSPRALDDLADLIALRALRCMNIVDHRDG